VTASLVTILGPPASGKTTLARQLAVLLGGELILEDYQSNPFLHEAYLGGNQADLPCQMYFLMSRARQLSRSTFPAEGRVVSDYDFCMDAVYARIRLRGRDWQTYQQVHARVEPLVRRADVLIRLDIGVQQLLGRIAVRGRDHERGITAGFLHALIESYDRMDLSACAGRVLRVDSESLDLRCRAACEPIARQVRQVLEVGA
jgi:deoxyadenosine/deoxycytidine kinase